MHSRFLIVLRFYKLFLVTLTVATTRAIFMGTVFLSAIECYFIHRRLSLAVCVNALNNTRVRCHKCSRVKIYIDCRSRGLYASKEKLKRYEKSFIRYAIHHLSILPRNISKLYPSQSSVAARYFSAGFPLISGKGTLIGCNYPLHCTGYRNTMP